MNWFLKTQYFMKFDIIHIFNQICIHENDEKYTAFQIKWKLFKQFMIFFNLKNEFNMFQYYINDMLHEFLNVFVTVYIDDILIYLNFLSEHQKHVWLILKWLWKADLQYNIQKCKFHASKIMYFDLIVFWKKIKMNSIKIKMILS